jgi:hypothetical protein
MNTATDSLETNTPKTGGGYTVGQSATDLVGFYGTTPAAQPSGAAQAAITDTSGGTASATTGLQALSGTYNSTLIANAISTNAAAINAVRNALVTLGLIKGSS